MPILIIFISILFICVAFGIYQLVNAIIKGQRYKKGRNPYHRICKLCDSNQEVMEGASGIWWEEVGYKGNNSKCKCHADAEYRHY